MAELEYISQYEGTEIDAAVGFGKSPDARPTLGSEGGAESGGIYNAIKESEYHHNYTINPYFIINQRGGSSYSNVSGLVPNTVDMWAVTATNMTVTPKEGGGITVVDSTGANAQLRQPMNPDELPWGKTITVSASVTTGASAATFKIAGWDSDTNSTSGWWSSTTITVPANTTQIITNTHTLGTKKNYVGIYIYTMGAATYDINGVKFEEGSISTLEFDLANGIRKNKGDELLKCMEYQIVFKNTSLGYGQCEGSNKVALLIPLPVPMRATPTLILSGDNVKFKDANGTNYNPLTTTQGWGETPTTIFGCYVSGTNLTIPTEKCGRVFVGSGSSAILDANLS